MKEKIIEKDGKMYKVIEIIKEYKTIKFKNKTYRIYKWEDKPIGDFPYLDKIISHKTFIELFDEKIIDYPKDWEVYFTKHYSKRKQKEGILSRCCLRWNSFLLSYNSNLSISIDNGRVVIEK